MTISNQRWLFDGNEVKGDATAEAWGQFAAGAGSNQLAWEAPDHGGAYTVKVTAKRHCGGAGALRERRSHRLPRVGHQANNRPAHPPPRSTARFARRWPTRSAQRSNRRQRRIWR